jgi:hypothetical protein
VRKVQHAGRMPEVRGPTARRTGVQRPGRTAGDLGRRTVRGRRARQRPARRAGDRGQGMAGGPAAPGKHAVLGRGGPCRNKAEGQARWGHLLPGYAVRAGEGRGRVALRRAGRTRLATRACRRPRRAVLRRLVPGRGGQARLAVLAWSGPRWVVPRRGGRRLGAPGPVVPAGGVLACRGLGRKRGGRGRIAVLVRWWRARPGGRRRAGRGRGARAGGQAAVRRRPDPGARAVPLMAFPQQ